MRFRSLVFHIGYWVVYIVIYTIVRASYKNDFKEAFVFELLNLPMRLIVAYFNYFFLLPILIYKNNLKKYILLTVLSMLVFGFLQRILNYEALNILNPNMPDYGLWLPYKFVQSVFVVGTPTVILIAIVSIQKMNALQEKTKNLENEKLNSELKYLKSQINPHFLFNNLNNIYGLALEKDKKTPELILKLSEFLSFSLYETNQKLIPIEKEISLMNNLIELEKSRFEGSISVETDFPKSFEAGVLIPPLVFVPFVENALKHSIINETEEAIVSIKLKVDDGLVIFIVKNSKPSETLQSNTNNGLGLKNIKKRLDLIYGENHVLEIEDKKSFFNVKLKIRHK